MQEGKASFSIPIRTWSRGKVLLGDRGGNLGAMISSTADATSADDSFSCKSLDGDLLEYFPPEPDENEIKETVDDFPSVESDGEEENISDDFQEFLNRNYPNEEIATREFQKLMSAYEFSKLEDDVEAMLSEEEGRVPSQPLLDMKIFDFEGKEAGNTTDQDEEYYPIEQDDVYDEDVGEGKNETTETSGKFNAYTKPGYVNGKKVPTSGYGPIDTQKKRQMMIWQERYKNFDAKAKLRDTLDDLALRKKIQEERANLQALKEEAKKRKLREQIERSVEMKTAMQTDSESSAVPSFLAPTKAYENQSVTKSKRKQDVVITSSEELSKQEEDRKAHITAIRRKFKEKHKQELENLIRKKKEMDRKVTANIFQSHIAVTNLSNLG